MNKLFVISLGLVLFIVGASLFLIIGISQGAYCTAPEYAYKFVVAEDGKYCYAAGHHNVNIKVRAAFDNLNDCEKYLRYNWR